MPFEAYTLIKSVGLYVVAPEVQERHFVALHLTPHQTRTCSTVCVLMWSPLCYNLIRFLFFAGVDWACAALVSGGGGTGIGKPRNTMTINIGRMR